MQLPKLGWAFGMGPTVLAGQVQEIDQGHGTVKFTGRIIDAPCSITLETIEQTVDLGETSNKSLLKGGKTGPRPFDIKLKSCDFSDLRINRHHYLYWTEIQRSAGYLAIVGSSACGADTGITNDEGINIRLAPPAPQQKHSSVITR